MFYISELFHIFSKIKNKRIRLSIYISILQLILFIQFHYKVSVIILEYNIKLKIVYLFHSYIFLFNNIFFQ